MFNKRKRTLSKNGEELFSIAMEKPKYFLTKKNSWNPESPKNLKKRRHTISCLPSLNLKRVFLDFITTDFDKKLEEHSHNMKSASKKLLFHLYQNRKKYPNLLITLLSILSF